MRQSKVDEHRIIALADVYDRSNAIDVPLDEVSSESISSSERALEIDSSAGAPIADRGSIERRRDRGDREPSRAKLTNREACAIERDALAQREIVVFAFDAELSARGRLGDARNSSDFFD